MSAYYLSNIRMAWRKKIAAAFRWAYWKMETVANFQCNFSAWFIYLENLIHGMIYKETYFTQCFQFVNYICWQTDGVTIVAMKLDFLSHWKTKGDVLNFDLRIGLSGVFWKNKEEEKNGLCVDWGCKLFLIGTGVWFLCRW